MMWLPWVAFGLLIWAYIRLERRLTITVGAVSANIHIIRALDLTLAAIYSCSRRIDKELHTKLKDCRYGLELKDLMDEDWDYHFFHDRVDVIDEENSNDG